MCGSQRTLHSNGWVAAFMAFQTHRWQCKDTESMLVLFKLSISRNCYKDLSSHWISSHLTPGQIPFMKQSGMEWGADVREGCVGVWESCWVYLNMNGDVKVYWDVVVLETISKAICNLRLIMFYPKLRYFSMWGVIKVSKTSTEIANSCWIMGEVHKAYGNLQDYVYGVLFAMPAPFYLRCLTHLQCHLFSTRCWGLSKSATFGLLSQ